MIDIANYNKHYIDGVTSDNSTCFGREFTFDCIILSCPMKFVHKSISYAILKIFCNFPLIFCIIHKFQKLKFKLLDVINKPLIKLLNQGSFTIMFDLNK